MGNKESNESAAVKRQAEGGANPMYLLLDLSGISALYSDPSLNNLFINKEWNFLGSQNQ